MRKNDRIVVLATERRGVMDSVHRNGGVWVLLDGDSEPHLFDAREIDVCCGSGCCEA